MHLGHTSCHFPYIMKTMISTFIFLMSVTLVSGRGVHEVADTLDNRIPFLLDRTLFIPSDRLVGTVPWHSAPITRPVVLIIPKSGFDGTVGFGQFSQEHPEKFFSTLEGYNSINIPHLYVTQQMMIGNTLRLAHNFYMLSGILYGTQMGVMGNNWGMGTREGFLWHPSTMTSILLWNQYFQSVSVYSPVVIPVHTGVGRQSECLLLRRSSPLECRHRLL